MDDFTNKIALFNIIFAKLSAFEKNDWEENFLVEFTHDSTAIEGNTLTLIETKMILTDRMVPAETSLRELDEVRDHADAWQFVKERARQGVLLSENLIKDIHERVVPAKGIGGVYRSIPVYIRGAQHIPPHPHNVWNAMKNFIYRMEHDEFSDGIEKAAWIHAEFVKIHPFQDGNGRTARLMMNHHLLQNGFPPTSIKRKNRQEYFASLEEYAVHDVISPFVSLLRTNMLREIDDFLVMYSVHIDLNEIRQAAPSLVTLAENYAER